MKEGAQVNRNGITEQQFGFLQLRKIPERNHPERCFDDSTVDRQSNCFGKAHTGWRRR
jgi:hypothetical protein